MDELIKKLRSELQNFVIGDVSLDEIFEPVILVCKRVAKNEQEFKQCVTEAITTLRSVLKKVR